MYVPAPYPTDYPTLPSPEGEPVHDDVMEMLERHILRAWRPPTGLGPGYPMNRQRLERQEMPERMPDRRPG
jgi:hypothetical protein